MSNNFIMTEDWLTKALADSIDIDWRSRDGARAILKAMFEQNVGIPSPSGQYRFITVDRLDKAILANQGVTWRGTDEEQYEARINACCSRRTEWPAQNCPRDGSCDDCWHDMAEALKAPTPLPDRFIHPDDFAREYQDSVNGKMPAPGHADGCGAHDDYACDCAAAPTPLTAPSQEEEACTIINAWLTDIQRAAIKGAIYLAGHWVLTTRYENNLEIIEDLPESIADPVSGILTPLGNLIRSALATQPATLQTSKLPDGFVHPDKFAREYQDSVKANAVCEYCNGTGYQLSGFSQKPSDRTCLACNKDDPDHAYWQSCKGPRS